MPTARRRTENTGVSVDQDILLPLFTTTNATPLTVYTSTVAIPEGRVLKLRADAIVLNTTTGDVGNTLAEGLVARKTGQNIRLTETNYVRAVGEIKGTNATIQIAVNTVTNRFEVRVTGKAATTYNWIVKINVFRNA